MKQFFTCVMVVAMLVSFTGVASAGSQSMDDMSWWAQSGATPNPVKDGSRSGYWWWPTTPTSNVNDSEVWGNRGVVYNMYTPAPPAPPVEAPRAVATPAPAPAPSVQRSVPVFNHVLFGYDSSSVKSAGNAEVANVAGILKDYPGDNITIEGHTDNKNGSGDPNYNTKLGQRRADAVKQILLDNGIAPGRVTTVSKGDTDPAVPNDTDANRAKNRRVIFVYKIND
ncbi:MAG: hypothetical protein COA73_11565 [Candidatus Hydrogenedentota bacterium]|nr:MAG: hypothetical protein COA73_11565 [Candidatus Hydrogenedentota bacterium]